MTPDNGFGNILFSRTAWGSKELFSVFGYDGAEKSVLSTIEAADALYKYQARQRSWIHLKDAIDELVSLCESVSPTTSADVLSGQLQAIWNKWESIMEGETPNEAAYLKTILKAIKDEVIPLRSVGRKVFKNIVYKSILNSFHVI